MSYFGKILRAKLSGGPADGAWCYSRTDGNRHVAALVQISGDKAILRELIEGEVLDYITTSTVAVTCDDAATKDRVRRAGKHPVWPGPLWAQLDLIVPEDASRELVQEHMQTIVAAASLAWQSNSGIEWV